jgi:hypothetical protein
MNGWALILAAAALGVGVGLGAHAQAPVLQWTDPAPQGPASVDSITRGLEDAGKKIASHGDQGVRAVYFDYVYPAAPAEYRALGANGVILISAVAHDPREFPLKRVYLHIGGRDVVLQPISGRQSELAPTSSLVKAIGPHRDDEFFLLPGAVAGQTAELRIDFGANTKAYLAGKLSLALADSLRADPTPPPPGQPDEAALRAVLAREYPVLVKP